MTQTHGHGSFLEVVGQLKLVIGVLAILITIATSILLIGVKIGHVEEALLSMRDSDAQLQKRLDRIEDALSRIEWGGKGSGKAGGNRGNDNGKNTPGSIGTVRSVRPGHPGTN